MRIVFINSNVIVLILLVMLHVCLYNRTKDAIRESNKNLKDIINTLEVREIEEAHDTDYHH